MSHEPGLERAASGEVHQLQGKSIRFTRRVKWATPSAAAARWCLLSSGTAAVTTKNRRAADGFRRPSCSSTHPSRSTPRLRRRWAEGSANRSAFSLPPSRCPQGFSKDDTHVPRVAGLCRRASLGTAASATPPRGHREQTPVTDAMCRSTSMSRRALPDRWHCKPAKPHRITSSRSVSNCRRHSGTVTFFDGTPQRPVELAAPAQAGLLVGRVYRLRVTNMPEFPNGEFFPSIDLVDRLHPPPGQVERFPVEMELFPEEFTGTENGRMQLRRSCISNNQTSCRRSTSTVKSG